MSHTAILFKKPYHLYNENDIATFTDEQAKRYVDSGVAEVFKENVEVQGSQTPNFTDVQQESKKSGKKKADPDADILG